MISQPLLQIFVGENILTTATIPTADLALSITSIWFIPCQAFMVATKIRNPDSFIAYFCIIYGPQKTDFTELSKNIVTSFTNAFLSILVQACILHLPGLMIRERLNILCRIDTSQNFPLCGILDSFLYGMSGI